MLQDLTIPSTFLLIPLDLPKICGLAGVTLLGVGVGGCGTSFQEYAFFGCIAAAQEAKPIQANTLKSLFWPRLGSSVG